MAPSLHSGFDHARGIPGLDARLFLELSLLTLLCASLGCTVMAVRFYNHAGFIGGMPVDSESRTRWSRGRPIAEGRLHVAAVLDLYWRRAVGRTRTRTEYWIRQDGGSGHLVTCDALPGESSIEEFLRQVREKID